MPRHRAYATALLDWLACAHAGAGERASRAVRASGDDLLTRVAFAGTAGHILDFDDTHPDGVVHVTAACAPAALVLGAHEGRTLGEVLDAYAEGFEAMAALAAASHPALYDRGWHPTAVCGGVGAATAAAALLQLSPAEREEAGRLALLRASGTRGAFGSDGKAIQVGLAAASGVQAALLARAGAAAGAAATTWFETVLGGRWTTAAARPFIDTNWIKLYPSCLGTHAPIEAAAAARAELEAGRPVEVAVHPIARQAAHIDDPDDGLQAKFSIPYCVAHTLALGAPARIHDFATVDPVVRTRARAITLASDPSLPEFGAVLTQDGHELARVDAPPGSPERPAGPDALAAKLSDLGADHLVDALADLSAPAGRVLAATLEGGNAQRRR